MHLLCPHCRNPIELVQLRAREEIGCPSCGSSFRVETDSTAAWEFKGGHKFGKYVILDTVGQGAFGTVFKARDPELDRIVALKVPRTGNLAGPRELDRFLREARSVAQLSHPSIVTIHDVSQVDGVPYLVSDFVEGVTLSDLLSARRPGFREAAELVAAVAEALHYAHTRGVVHRDVKSSNIMIGPDGTAFVLDFGLAKREAGEITMTVEGQVLGTPAYMSPEQARGEGHQLDARGDVYSLGVVLYQLLTGELPFRGTARMLLHQVLHDEPRSLRSLNDRIPRDLETIALKAMAKEPGRRYTTAQEMGDDLRRWLKGETIHARPVSPLERAARWGKRNPGLAACLAAIVAVLLTATVISTVRGMDARTKGAAALAARKELVEKNRDLELSQTEINNQNIALERLQDQQEEALVRIWLSPLAETTGPLNDGEIAAFTDLAASRNDRLAVRFVTEALRDRQGIRRLGARSAFAVHAAVGLDSNRRQEVEHLLVHALELPDLPEDTQVDLALAAFALGDLSPTSAPVVGKKLLPALARTSEAETLDNLASRISAFFGCLEAKDAAETLLEAMNKTTDGMSLGYLAQNLSKVSARLDPKEAGRVSAQAAFLLLQGMEKTKKSETLVSLATGLSAVLGHLDANEAARISAKVVGILTLAMQQTDPDDFMCSRLEECLLEVFVFLESKEANTILTNAITKTADKWPLLYLAKRVSAVSAHLNPKEVEEIAAQLIRGMMNTKKVRDWSELAFALSEVSDRLEPKAASRMSAEAIAILAQIMIKMNDERDFAWMEEAVSVVSKRLETKDARVTTATLLDALKKTNDGVALNSIARTLRAVAGRLEAKETVRVSSEAAAILTKTILNTKSSRTLGYLADGLSEVFLPLDAKDAANVSSQAATALTNAISKTNANDTPGLRSLAWGLCAVADRLEAKEAEEAANILLQTISKTTDPKTLCSLADGVSALSGRLEAKQALRVSAESITMLNKAMAKTQDIWTFATLAKYLSAHMDAKEAEETAAKLTNALTITYDQSKATFSKGRNLAYSLKAVAMRMEPKDGVATLLYALTKTDIDGVDSMGQGLAVVSARLDANDAARIYSVATQLTEAMAKWDDSDYAYRALGESLQKVYRQDERNKFAAAAATIACLHDSRGIPAALFLQHPGLEPFPRRLSDQDLVELLKHPLCVGAARRVVLDQLEFHHQRKFADQWDFVRFAEKQKLGLDFTSPPKRR